MSAGTAQKVALNLFSTLTMIRLGRVYRGMMVDVIPSNAKLRERAVRIVTAGSDTDDATAQAALDATGYAVKPAILVARGSPRTMPASCWKLIMGICMPCSTHRATSRRGNRCPTSTRSGSAETSTTGPSGTACSLACKRPSLTQSATYALAMHETCRA